MYHYSAVTLPSGKHLFSLISRLSLLHHHLLLSARLSVRADFFSFFFGSRRHLPARILDLYFLACFFDILFLEINAFLYALTRRPSQGERDLWIKGEICPWFVSVV